MTSPRPAPTSGIVVAPVACTADQRNSAVSMPSRPTARKATATRPHAAPAMARSTAPCSSERMSFAVRSIQNTIQVTRPVATMERDPPMASCASNVSP